MKLYTTPEDRQIATLTAEVSRLTAELDAASARLHEVATLCATVEQERDRLTGELEKEKAQSRHLAGAVSRKIEDLIAVENQRGYYKMQYSRAEQVRKEACEANAKAQAKTLWLENELAAMQEQRDSLRDECERLLGELRSAKINAAHAASQLSYVKHEKDLLRCAVKHVAEADTSNKRVTVGALIHITQEALFDDAARQSHRENNEMAELAALSASGREE